MGAYAGAARRRVHLATVFLGLPSGNFLGSRRARQVHIPQIGLHLTQPLSMWMVPRHGPAAQISTRKYRWAGSSQGVAPHDNRGVVGAHELCRYDLSQLSLPGYHVILVMPPVAKDSMKRHSTEGVQPPCQQSESRTCKNTVRSAGPACEKHEPSSFCTSIGSATHLHPSNSSRSRLVRVVD